MEPSLVVLFGVNVVGALCAATGRAHLANAIWSVTNPVIIWYNYSEGMLEQSMMYVTFWIIALYGVYYHFKEKCNHEVQ